MVAVVKRAAPWWVLHMAVQQMGSSSSSSCGGASPCPTPASPSASTTTARAALRCMGVTPNAEALREAARSGDVDRVGVVCAACTPEDISAGCPEGNTALHIASALGSTAVCKALLAAGASPHPANASGCTPLHAATDAREFDTAQLLLQHGADPNATPASTTPTCLSLAIRHLDAPLARLLLQHGASLTPAEGEEHPLYTSAREGSVELCRALLDAGVSAEGFEPALQGGGGRATRSPLQLAAEGGHADLCALLLERGADATRRCPMGWPPLVEAAHGGHAGAVAALCEPSGSDICAAALAVALHAGHASAALELLPHTESGCGAPPGDLLLLACARGQGGALAPLLLDSFGAPPDARDSEGRTPLMFAAASGDTAAVGALLSSGADVHAGDALGMTALMHAVSGGVGGVVGPDVVEVCRALICHGANADTPDTEGRSALGRGSALGGGDAAAQLLRLLRSQARLPGERVCATKRVMIQAFGEEAMSPRTARWCY